MVEKRGTYCSYRNINILKLSNKYIWNPNDLYFCRSTLQNKAFSNQKKGHLTYLCICQKVQVELTSYELFGGLDFLLNADFSY